MPFDQTLEQLESLLTVDSQAKPETDSATPNELVSSPGTSKADEVLIDRIDRKLSELASSAAQLERERLEIQDLRSQLQHAIDAAELRIAQADTRSIGQDTSGQSGIVESMRIENERLNSLLNHSRAEYQTLLDFIENEDIKELTTVVRNEHIERECELNREIDKLKEKNQLLEDELGSSLGTGSESELRKQITTLKSELMETRHEVVELRLHSNELASRLAKYQDPSTISHEAVTWEDRKQALLQILEQQELDSNEGAAETLDIKRILDETSAQVNLKDKEIADLRSLLEQQSVAANGMAIGAAAVAQFVDADEIIAEERQRLKEKQQQWEQKQRQDEIEMSLERAKLARERLEIQEKLQQLEAERASQVPTDGETASSPRSLQKGKWWARLGLKDD
ncbi:hypothetical protein SH449x_005119 [Pirellulaceae bacterium SH449]